MDTFPNPSHGTEPLVIPSQSSLEEFTVSGPQNNIRQHMAGNASVKTTNTNLSQVSISPTTEMVSSHMANGHLEQNTSKMQTFAQSQPQKQSHLSTLQSSMVLPQQLYNGNFQQQQKRRSPASQGNQINIQAELQDSYGILQQQQHPNSSHDTSQNSNLSHTLRTQLSQTTLTPQQRTGPPGENGAPGTTITPQIAAAIMGDRGNVSQRQMAQLQQLQATYGSLQTHLSKQTDNDGLQRKRSSSITFSPGKAFGIITKLQSESMLPSNGRVLDDFNSPPASLVASMVDVSGKHAGNVSNSQMPNHGNQRKYSSKGQVFSAHSSRVTTPFQDPLSQTPLQQNFSFNSQLNSSGQPISANGLAPHQQQQQNRSQQQQQQQAQPQPPPQPQSQPQAPPLLQQQSQPHFNISAKHVSGQNPTQKAVPSLQHPPRQTPQFPTQPYVSSHSTQNARLTEPQGLLSEEVRRNLSNISIVRLLRFHDLITCRHEKPNLPYLRHVVGEFFAEDATFDICLKYANENRNFRISYSLVPLLYYKYLENVQMFELAQKFLSSTLLSNGHTLIETDHFSFKCVFEDGSYCNHFGSLKIRVNRNLMFEKVELVTDYNVYGLEFAALEKFLDGISNQEKMSSIPLSSQVKSHFKCISDLTKFGIEEDLLRLMQISDVMTLAKPLINFYVDSKSLSPLEALETFNKLNFPAFQKLNSMNAKLASGRDSSSETSGAYTVVGSASETQNSSVNQNMPHPDQFTSSSNFSGSATQMPANSTQFSQQMQVPMHIRSHQNSISGIFNPKSGGPSMPNQLTDNASRSMLPSPDASYSGKNPYSKMSNINGMGSNTSNINVNSTPLKKSTSEGNTITQVVSRKVSKKFKLQAPPVPKSTRKRKVSSASIDERSVKRSFIKKEHEAKLGKKNNVDSNLSFHNIKENDKPPDMNELGICAAGESMTNVDSSNSNSIESELGNETK